MKERPILFSGSMVRALLAGTKTQTRRAMKPQPRADVAPWAAPNPDAQCWRSSLRHAHGTSTVHTCPYGQPGDRLWVRESHWFFKDEHDPVTGYFPPKLTVDDVVFRADGEDSRKVWRPSIHMPRWASRITLEISEVRVERLQDITEADALAEGIEAMRCPDCHLAGYGLPGWGHDQVNPTAKEAYRYLWSSINGAESWDQNPWVWVIEIGRI